MTLGDDGNLYGTAQYGGSADSACAPNGCGTVFKLTRSESGWAYAVIYTFHAGFDAAYPTTKLRFDRESNLYGTTSGGGNGPCLQPGGCGTVFKLSPSGSGWTESVIYRFQGNSDGNDPGGVVVDSSGNLYGTTHFGGSQRGVITILGAATFLSCLLPPGNTFFQTSSSLLVGLEAIIPANWCRTGGKSLRSSIARWRARM